MNCSDQGNGEACQSKIFAVDGTDAEVVVYGLNTVGVTDQILYNGAGVAVYSDNLDGFVDTIIYYTTS